MDNLRFNIDRFHGRVGSANNMVQMKPNKFYTKTGNLWFNPTNIPVNPENNTPIEIRKEIKSAYSFNWTHIIIYAVIGAAIGGVTSLASKKKTNS